MSARHALRQAGLYGRTVARVAQRGFRERGCDPALATERIVFVVGSPRSGTTFLAGAVGSQPGFVDLGEVRPVKSSIRRWASLPEDEAAAELRSTLERVRRLGFVRDLRPVEQTPELSFVVGAAVRAYPEATVLHIIRDGRDVVCSLLERGWLREREGHDDAGQPYGTHARAWVEPERRDEFVHAREATRAAWAWRSYLTAARREPEHTLEIRYEEIAADPTAAAARIAGRLDTDPEELAAALGEVHNRSIGRWRRDLTPEQIDDVEREAGPLLRDLGYA
ncbi:MAG TPA: sulfotransferase [Gaiellaceae bacterium]|nr:sulfotransferase [Gaiellaceae bacterium]